MDMFRSIFLHERGGQNSRNRIQSILSQKNDNGNILTMANGISTSSRFATNMIAAERHCLVQQQKQRGFVGETLESLATWFIKRTFQPSIVRRKRKWGFLKRIKSRLGKKIILRRMLKGRKALGW